MQERFVTFLSLCEWSLFIMTSFQGAAGPHKVEILPCEVTAAMGGSVLPTRLGNKQKGMSEIADPLSPPP